MPRLCDMADAARGDDWEYAPIRIPSTTGLKAAAQMLSAQAGVGGWELARVLKYADGTRKVVMRRRRRHEHLPQPIL
ncbi:DUF5703 family protein [Epidermidibacterium keratini]